MRTLPFCPSPLLPFCAVAALLISALPASADDAVKRDDSTAEKLGLKLSLQCWTYNKLTFFEAVDRAARLGVKYVEGFPGQKVRPDADDRMGQGMSEEAVKAVKTKLKEAGVKLVAFGVNGIPADPKKEGKDTRAYFEWAKMMGIEVLVTETPPNETIDKLSAEFGIRVALHNHPATWQPDKVLAACKDKGKLLGSCSDTGHWMRAKFVPVEALKKLEGRVQHLHFKDLNEFGNGHDVVWGTGKGDIAGILAELKRQGYKGYLSIEFEYGNLEHLDTNLPKCVAFFDKTCKDLGK